LPPIVISNIINHTSSTIDLNRFKNKLVILDFMATSCKGCIEKLPVIDSLQRKYANYLQVILVSYEDRQRMQKFMQSKWGKYMHMPVAVNDSVMKGFFPHRYLSHLVWIYKGKVIGITGSQYADETSVAAVLSNARVLWPVKKDFNEYDFEQPMLAINANNVLEESHPSNVFYSAFSGALDGVPTRSVMKVDSLKNVQRISMINMPILGMWLKALKLPGSFPPSHLLLQVKDSNRYIYNAANSYRDQWRLRNTYCYEAVFPLEANEQQKAEKIKTDLQYYTGARATLEQRTTDCTVLVKKGNAAKALSDSATKDGVKLVSITTLLYQLNLHSIGVPVVNETGFAKEKYLPLRINWIENRQYLQEVLQQYGLYLDKQQRMQEMLVLSENNH
jgi:thiol-disulfide isomerase/thioredoxin